MSFVIPNLQHDMHDGTVAQGDTWLQTNLSGYATWAQTHNSLLVVTFDEDDAEPANRIATIIAGASVVPGHRTPRRSTTTTCCARSRTLTAWPAIGNSATPPPIVDIWSSASR